MTTIETALALIWANRMLDEQLDHVLLMSLNELWHQNNNYADFGKAVAYRHLFGGVGTLLRNWNEAWQADVELAHSVFREFKNRVNWEEVGLHIATRLRWNQTS